MKQVPINIESFEEIRAGNYLYVDKTAILHKLITTESKYFLSRPRRFGKSLTCSTLDAIFSGKRELFQGLYISKTDYSWPVHPILRLNLSGAFDETVQQLRDKLERCVRKEAARHKIDLPNSGRAEDLFEDLIIALSDTTSVVLIIDEYDKPITDHIDDLPLANGMRHVLASFYGVIKPMLNRIRFVFVTGVSKFTKSSVFSVLNVLTDISMDIEYSTLVGYTEDELKNEFKDHITAWCEQKSVSFDEGVEILRTWYDGYRFHGRSEPVYSPLSIMKVLTKHEIKSYWYETAPASLLMRFMKQKEFSVLDFENTLLSEKELDPDDIEKLSLISILYQTGYLTLKPVKESISPYPLTFPNTEVRQAFLERVLTEITEKRNAEVESCANELRKDLEEGDVNAFLENLYTFLAGVPTTLKLSSKEDYWQALLYTILKMVTANTSIIMEDRTNIGRIDATVLTQTHIFIFELKIGKSAKKAMGQIIDKGYFEKYRRDKRKLVLIGVSFDYKKRNIVKPWHIE